MAITKASDLAKLLADGVVGTTEIGDGQITTAKIADSAITTDKLASNAVTAAQLSVSGDDIPYDNSVSGMSANTLQEAIDYLNVVTGGGSAGAQATYTRDAFTATAGQTTFTTSNGYTLGYVQVFMNGVLLALTDYVANDESTVVLSVGASLGDEIVIVAYDSFAISEVLRVLNLSASAPDDALTVDGDGNLLIGMTTSSGTATGVRVISSGFISAKRDGSSTQSTAVFGKGTSDGVIVGFNKNDVEMGSIGTQYGNLVVASGDSGLLFYENSPTDTQIVPCKADGTLPTNDINLGNSGRRFKDLYLSGGVYLGGTSASNHLDDYEEGTWTPVFDTTTGSLSDGVVTSIDARYIKIGNLVTVSAWVHMSAAITVTSHTYVRGLPFDPLTSVLQRQACGTWGADDPSSGAGKAGIIRAGYQGNTLTLYGCAGGSVTDNEFIFSATYMVS